MYLIVDLRNIIPSIKAVTNYNPTVLLSLISQLDSLLVQAKNLTNEAETYADLFTSHQSYNPNCAYNFKPLN
jgi:hypothetical protein